MKKILSIAAALVAAVAFISCGDSGDSFDGSTDTVINVGSPSVKAKAYPGVNYIEWTAVPQAAHYELYRTADGETNSALLLDTSATGDTGKLAYADVAKADLALADGVTYKYTVFAIGANVGANTAASGASRAVYLKSSQGSATVKAIVPTLATDLAKFTDLKVNTYKDYLAKFAKISDPVIVNGKFSTQFKATAGLKYAIQFLKADWITNKISYANAKDAEAAGVSITWKDNYKENFLANLEGMTKESGKFTAYLTIASVSDLYNTSVVQDLGTIEVKDIGEKSGNATSGVEVRN